MDLLKTLSAAGEFATPIVDAHHHLWDLKAGRYPTKQDQYDKNFFLGDYRAICRDYMPSDYVEALKGFDVVGSVHIQAARAMDEQVAETEWLGTVKRRFGSPQKPAAALTGRAFRFQVTPFKRGGRSDRGS